MNKLFVSRRQVLRGAGGVTLALPILPSLLPRGASAAALGARPRLVTFTSDHGAVWTNYMHPAPSTLTEKVQAFPGHQISRGLLKRTVAGANASLSPILTAPSSLLTDRLVGKMNALLGWSIPFYIAHNRGGHLGNFAVNDGNGGGGKYAQQFPMPTIDQVMAWSPSFYPSLNGIKERSITISGRQISSNYSNPATKTGQIQSVTTTGGPADMFDKLFQPATVPTQMPPANRRPLLVDAVVESFKSLRNSNRRLSNADKQRLDDHMGRIAELQRGLSVNTVSSTAACGAQIKPQNVSRGEGSAAARKYYGAINDVIVAGFACGTTRIATVDLQDGARFIDYTGDFHEQVAHSTWMRQSAMDLMVQADQRMFEWSFLDLVSKLDAIEDVAGTTLLDNSLVQWAQESGPESHTSDELPVIMAGSAGGYFKTGWFCDYRNLTPLAASGGALNVSGQTPKKWTGLPWTRWLGTILQSMGLPRSEYEKPDMPGYGLAYAEERKRYVPGALESASQPAPFITAG